MHALTRLDIGAAIGLNVLTVSALPLLVFLWGRWIRRQSRATARPAPVHPRFLWLMLGVVVVFWVMRNLPAGAALAP